MARAVHCTDCEQSHLEGKYYHCTCYLYIVHGINPANGSMPFCMARPGAPASIMSPTIKSETVENLEAGCAEEAKVDRDSQQRKSSRSHIKERKKFMVTPQIDYTRKPIPYPRTGNTRRRVLSSYSLLNFSTMWV